MVKFISKEKKSSKITFSDVPEDQFFVSVHGAFYQKISHNKAVTIANNDGKPFCDEEYFEGDEEIDRIVLIEKIEF